MGRHLRLIEDTYGKILYSFYLDALDSVAREGEFKGYPRRMQLAEDFQRFVTFRDTRPPELQQPSGSTFNLTAFTALTAQAAAGNIDALNIPPPPQLPPLPPNAR